MNLSEMLGYADIGQLSRIAVAYRCECSGNSKNELIQSILSTIGRSDVFEEQVREMKLEDLRFLNSLLFDPREAYSLEDLIARVQQSRFGAETAPSADDSPKQVSKTKGKSRRKKTEPDNAPASPRDMIAKFKHQGWLFNGFSGPGKYLFQVPGDLKARFREAMARRLREGLKYTGDPEVYREESGMLQSDVKQLLHYAWQNEVQLTADGSMYKRYLTQAIDRLAVRERLPGRGEWRFGYGRHFNHYPDRFSLLYDYCCSSGYLLEQNGTLAVTEKGLERMQASPPGELESIYSYWLKLYKLPIANLPAFVHWIGELASDWVTADSVKQALGPFVKPYYYDSASSILEVRIMKMMLHLGLLRIGEHSAQGAVIRMTKAGGTLLSGRPAREKGASSVDTRLPPW